MSFKVIEKFAPDEKVGVVVTVDGRPQVIEYSDLYPKLAELAERRAPEGNLELWAGSIAIHILERTFIERLVGDVQLPIHRADKKVAFVDDSGTEVRPEQPNAVKFERFIFDALPQAQRWAIVETNRATEFEPLKNATGPDSPATVRQPPERPLRRLARARGRHRLPPPRRDGPIRHRDQSPVRARRGRVEGEAGTRVGGGRAAVLEIGETIRR